LTAWLRGAVLLPLGAFDAWRVLSRRRPSVVVGVGGYSSGPVVALAALRGVPTLVMEQNAMPGLTNRMLARLVDGAAVTYEESVRYFGGGAFVAGNPVRPEFLEPASPQAPGLEPRGPAATRVLIFGGSQGAHAINVALMEGAAMLAAARPTLDITHQTGDRDLGAVRDAYSRAGLAARVEPFLFAMDREMKSAEVVVCRAGATTLAELTAAGRPSILIPLPTATDDHQRKNAQALVDAGAALLLDQRDLTAARLVDTVRELAADPERLQRMGAAARRLARPDAAQAIAERIVELGKG
jgi:UDP-N-acetylglucosamine--N-acetylmuramyl-(pentapeptide) pyrophosphoryl-undecaprenol N-acetylglucosamine transferase